MKEKFIDFVKDLPKKYGWKFWASIAFGIITAISGFEQTGILWLIPNFFGGALSFILIYWIYYFLIKALFKTGKFAGKTAAAAGKGAVKGVVFAAAAGVASHKGKSLAGAIVDGGKAVEATNRLFGKKKEHSNFEDLEEDYIEEPITKESKKQSSTQKNTPKKKIRKVWRCTYIGSHSQAPAVVDVPSENASGAPTGKEITAALEAMGYDHSLASSISNGGDNLSWRWE